MSVLVVAVAITTTSTCAALGHTGWVDEPPGSAGQEPPTWPHLGALELEDILGELRSRARLAQDAQRRMTGLLDAVVAVSSDLDLSLVLSRIVHSACELVDATYGALGVLAPHGERLVEFVTQGISEDDRRKIGDPPHGRGVLGLLIRDPRPRRMRDIAAHPDSYGFPPNHPPMSSFLGTPVTIRGQVFGNLYMSEKRGAPEFTKDDEAILVALAAAAGVAIDNARLYDRSQREGQLSDAVGEMTQHLLEDGDAEAALRIMATRSRALTDADFSVVALYDDQRRLLVRATSDERPHHAVGQPLDAGRWEDIVGEREPLLLLTHGDETPAPEARTVRQLGAVADQGPTALVAIAVGDAELGLLGVAWRTDADSVAAESVAPLREFGRTAALALEAASARRHRVSMELLEDRDRIARDMHDHVIQRLFATGLSLQSASRMTEDVGLGKRLDDAVDELDSAIKDIRQAIFALHRPLGGPGIRAELAELIEQAAAGLEFGPELDVVGVLDELPELLEAEMLAVVREGLANVVRHAQASWCAVHVGVLERLLVRIEDDGLGVQPDVQRSGLANLVRRAERLGGTLRVESREPSGCKVTWEVPLASTD